MTQGSRVSAVVWRGQVQAGEELDARVVVVVVREGRRHERTRVTDDHADRPKPSYQGASSAS